MKKNKRKNVIKTVALILASVSLFSIVACSDDDKNAGKEEIAGRKREVVLTDRAFVENGKSEYQIVVSNRATRGELFAAIELQTFVKEASGVELNVVSDYGLAYDENSKFVSIGETSVSKNYDTKLDEVSKFGEEAFVVKTFDNTAVLQGCNERANIYAAYEFMNVLFDFEVYAEDEIYVKKSSTISWKEMDVIEYPDFEGRLADGFTTKKSDDFRARLRANMRRIGDATEYIGESPWSQFIRGHNSFTILPPATYLQAHPDWYGGVHHGMDDQQLCYSSLIDDKDGMRQEFVKNLKYYIEKEPNAKWFCPGQEDYATWCSCSQCKKYLAQYGGVNKASSGMLVQAFNLVARDIKAWLQAEHPERADEVVLILFAYHGTIEPPLDADGNPVIYADDNVGVRMAPLNECYSHSYDHQGCSVNGRMPAYFEGWHKISKQLFVWTYSLMVYDYMVGTNDLYTYQSNLQFLKENGVIDIFYQGARDCETPFAELKIFLQSKLLWNTELDLEGLVDDFMDKYYQETSDIVKQFYYEYLYHCLKFGEENAVHFRPIEFTQEKDLFPKNSLNKWLELLNKALAQAETIEDTARREKIYKRVLSETMCIRYQIIDLYGADYEKTVIEKMIDDFVADAKIVGVQTLREDVQGGEFLYTPAKKALEWKAKYL